MKPVKYFIYQQLSYVTKCHLYVSQCTLLHDNFFSCSSNISYLLIFRFVVFNSKLSVSDHSITPTLEDTP